MTNLSTDVQFLSDCRVLIISDISSYSNISDVENLLLEVKPPGKDCFISFDLVPKFKEILNCASLQLCCETCPDNFSILPDGNYEIKISIDPNLETVTEYNYFRVCQLYKKYIKANCTLFKEKCNYKKTVFDSKVDELFLIKEEIMSAKYSAEECLDLTTALELYTSAQEKLDKINNEYSCSTC